MGEADELIKVCKSWRNRIGADGGEPLGGGSLVHGDPQQQRQQLQQQQQQQQQATAAWLASSWPEQDLVRIGAKLRDTREREKEHPKRLGGGVAGVAQVADIASLRKEASLTHTPLPSEDKTPPKSVSPPALVSVAGATDRDNPPSPQEPS